MASSAISFNRPRREHLEYTYNGKDEITIYDSNNTLPTLFSIPDGEHFIRHFINLKSSKSIYTAKSYERDIKDFFKAERIEDITIEDIINVSIFDAEKYMMNLIRVGRENSTVNRKISSLSSLYKWLVRYQDNRTGFQLIRFNPFASLGSDRPKVDDFSNTDYLVEEEAVRLINSFDESTILGLRNKAIIALALTTAIRKSEIINIKLKHIMTVGGYDVIKIRRKGNVTDYIKLQPPVRYLILQYINKTDRNIDNHKESYLFIGHSDNKLNGEKLNKNSLNLMIKKASERAGIKKELKVHSTRHSAITMALVNGASPEKVRDLAGHKNLSTTNRYIRSIDKFKNNAGDFIKIL